MDRDLARREAFEQAALPILGALHHAAAALCRREAEAADLVQETLLRAWRGFHTYERDDNFKAWLFRILRNAWVDLGRRRPREPLLHLEEEGAGMAAAPSGDGERPAAPDPERILPDHLLRAFESLPPGQRLLVLLCDLHSMSYREAAEILGCPIGSVMSGLHNARKRMRARLAGGGA